MKSRNLIGFLSILFILSIPVNFFPQNFKTVHNGVEHAEVTRKIGDDPVKLHLLRLDLKKVRLDVHHAMDAAIGTEKTSSIATRHGAVAAINAGFFRLDTSIFAGDSAGLLLINGNLLSESTNNRVALSVFNTRKETKALIAPIDIQAWLVFSATRFQVKLSGVNRERKENEIVIYSRDFGETTQTAQSGTDIILTNCKHEFKKKHLTNVCQIAEVNRGVSNSRIPNEGYVVSLSPGDFKSKKMFLYDLDLYLSKKYKARTFYIRLEDEKDNTTFLTNPDSDIIAGVPQLIKTGKIDITWEQEKASKSFVETRHPRTAVAKLKDGKFLMITVDGRQPGVSVGMNLYELADYLLELGAVDAMNLDGGGSTTMFLDGKVVNKPSDKEGERKVGDAILVTLRKK